MSWEDELVRGVQPLVGWRGYRLSRPHLLVCNETVIMPRERNEAVCDLYSEHTAPENHCSCGFYAFKSLAILHEQSYDEQDVLAEVWLYGKVAEHQLGFRAQYCYPKCLYVMEEKWQPQVYWLGEVYGCEAVIGCQPLVEARKAETAREEENRRRREEEAKAAKLAKMKKTREYNNKLVEMAKKYGIWDEVQEQVRRELRGKV